MFNLPMVVQLASVRHGFEPKWCESRIYDIFLAEMQTQVDQTLKSHCPAALALLLGKEPGGTLPLTPNDNAKYPHHLSIPLQSLALWFHKDLTNWHVELSGLREGGSHLEGKPPRGKACHCSSEVFPASVLPHLPQFCHICIIPTLFSHYTLLLNSHFYLHLFNETQSY